MALRSSWSDRRITHIVKPWQTFCSCDELTPHIWSLFLICDGLSSEQASLVVHLGCVRRKGGRGHQGGIGNHGDRSREQAGLRVEAHGVRRTATSRRRCERDHIQSRGEQGRCKLFKPFLDSAVQYLTLGVSFRSEDRGNRRVCGERCVIRSSG